MRYIAALDHDHLDNGVFLTSVAKSLARQQENQNVRSIIIHSDSEYTERIIQTGVMREEAVIRSIKDLNKRLVALFADQGISTIGINPFQRSLIILQDNELQMDQSFLDKLSDKPVLLLSTLVEDSESGKPVNIPLPKLMQFLYDALAADECFIFSKSDQAEIFAKNETSGHIKWKNIATGYQKEYIPDEFEALRYPVRLTTGRDFNQIPDLTATTLID